MQRQLDLLERVPLRQAPSIEAARSAGTTAGNHCLAKAEDVAKFGEDGDMGRPAQPEEISPAYVFLASPVTASYVNGVVLPVMGGPRG